MSYESKVARYIKKLDNTQATQLMNAIRYVIKDGYDYQWVYVALRHKSEEEWQKWGYGLFKKQSFRKQIQNKVKKIQEIEASDDPKEIKRALIRKYL